MRIAPPPPRRRVAEHKLRNNIEGHSLNIEQLPVTKVGSTYEQKIRFNDGQKRRTEIFCGRTLDELDRMVVERVRELKILGRKQIEHHIF